jgi:hypothetical protein
MTQAEIRDLVAKYLDEDRASAQRYVSDTVIDLGIQYSARIYAFLTLAIEKSGNLTVAAGSTFASVLSTFPLWIAPLRITQNSAHIQRDTLMSFRARKNAWRNATGIPERYAQIGASAIAFHPPPVSSAVATFSVRYAAFPANTDEIVPEDHQAIADGAAAIVAGLFLGGQTTAGADERLSRYMEAIKLRAEHVRQRSSQNRFDTLPTPVSKEALKNLLENVTK